MRRLALLPVALALAGCSSSAGSGGSGSPSNEAGGGGGDAANGADVSTVDSTIPGADSGGPGSDSGTTGADAQADAAPSGPCPVGMVLITTYCIDQWEAHVVELDDAGAEVTHSPYDVVDGLDVRAKTAGSVVPQGYISQVQATQACANAGKRLCTVDEFHLACEGPNSTNWYPYGGETHIPGYCNEGKGSEMPILFGNNAANWTYADFNDPRLNQIDGGLAPTASYPHCQSPYGIYDCVGNLHEWGSDPSDVNGHGRFRGGFYGDAEINGHGCLYVTSAHAPSYHDYSTGFRCCADAAGGG